MKKRVAIIGTGIAGMSTAHRLWERAEVTVFDKNNYVGGHTNTIDVQEGDSTLPIDTGFMVYNETTYPLLTKLFCDLGVKTRPTKMSFSVQHLPSNIEFAGTGWSGLFAQRSNLINLRHWKLLREIHRFNQTCCEVLDRDDLATLTLKEYCDLRSFSHDFRNHYLLPMSSAVWSSVPSEMLQFPAKTLVRFFLNHRFLSLRGQFVWRTVVGGSKLYRDRLIEPFAQRILLRKKVVEIESGDGLVRLRDEAGESHVFDAVVIATHADEALKLLRSPTKQQKDLLAVWNYQPNTASLHTDETVMPKRRLAWTSWNYRVDKNGSSTTYWMNELQAVSENKNYFVSINGANLINGEKVICQIHYEHPVFDMASVESQEKLPLLNEEGRIYFCGSYFRYGFHEDALMSGFNAADAVLRRLTQ